MVSIIATTLEVEHQSTFTLLYGNRSASTIMFHQELEQLQSQFPGRLRIIHFLSRETDRKSLPASAENSYQSGRIDPTAIHQCLTEGQSLEGINTWYLCGPGDLISNTKAALLAESVDPANIYLELFDAELATNLKPIRAHKKGNSQVKIYANGNSETVNIAQSEIILDAVIQTRDDIPYSCMTGTCGSCRAKVLTGKTEMIDVANPAISAEELENGYVLSCLCYPDSEELALDFSA